MNRVKAEFFDSQAAEHWAVSEYSVEEKRKIEGFVRVAGLRPGMRVLEPGCGTGRLTEILAHIVGPAGLVVAVDISSSMVDACRERLGTYSNIRIVHGAVEALSNGHERFDLVVCHNVYPHFDDKPEVTRKLVSMLAPSGKFVVFHFMNSDWINDLHHKVSPVVMHDLMPPAHEMELYFTAAGMKIDWFRDDDEGYLLIATTRHGSCYP